MECLYHLCDHNSSEHSCDFLKLPSDQCAQKIWRRYANICRDDIRSVGSVFDARICTCHFDDSSDYPIPHYLNTKRRFTEQNPNGHYLKRFKSYPNGNKSSEDKSRTPTIKLVPIEKLMQKCATNVLQNNCTEPSGSDNELLVSSTKQKSSDTDKTSKAKVLESVSNHSKDIVPKIYPKKKRKSVVVDLVVDFI